MKRQVNTTNNQELARLKEKRVLKVQEMMKNIRNSRELKDMDVHQPCNPANRDLVYDIVEDYIRQSSTIIDVHHLEELCRLAQQGHSCIVMSEHYSNFDTIGLYYIVRKRFPHLLECFDNFVFLAAAKLNVESKIVLAFSEAMNRLVIYPAREKNTGIYDEEEARTLEQINKKSFLMMQEMKKKGKIIFMFPSGTRYREYKPESKRILEQTAGFLKRFEYMCLIGISGNVLRVQADDEKMANDLLVQDTLVYQIKKPQLCKDFLGSVQDDLGELAEDAANIKKGVSQKIEEELSLLHKKAESAREPLVRNNPPHVIGSVI